MKKLVLPIVLIAGILYLVSGKVHRPLQAPPCASMQAGAPAEKDILPAVEPLLWALEAL